MKKRKSRNLSIKSTYKLTYEMIDLIPDKSSYICKLIEKDLAENLKKFTKEEFIENFHLIT